MAFASLRIACRHLNALVWILAGLCCCGGQVADNPARFGVVSLFGVAPLDPALFPQHRKLLVVGKGDSVTGQPGWGLPSHAGRLHRLRQEWVAFLLRTGRRNSPRAN